MRTLPARAAKQKAFCTKCDETHDKPVGRQCLSFATTSVIMGDSDASSISSIPLGQCDQASTEKIASDDSPDKFDIILKHIQRLDRGHGGRVVTLSPPTSAAGVRSPSWP